jgi:hypothetical protein
MAWTDELEVQEQLWRLESHRGFVPDVACDVLAFGHKRVLRALDNAIVKLDLADALCVRHQSSTKPSS